MVTSSPALNAVLRTPQNTLESCCAVEKSNSKSEINAFKLNYFSLKIFIPKIKTLPASAGTNKLMNQIPKVVPKIPNVLML